MLEILRSLLHKSTLLAYDSVGSRKQTTCSLVFPLLPSKFLKLRSNVPTKYNFITISAAYGSFRTKRIYDTEAFSFFLLSVASTLDLVMKPVSSSPALTGHLPIEDRYQVLAGLVPEIGLSISVPYIGLSISDFTASLGFLARFT